MIPVALCVGLAAHTWGDFVEAKVTKQIPLTQGQVALVDDADYEWLSKFKWHAQWNSKSQTYYAKRNASGAERLRGTPSNLFMHTAINLPPKGFETDHIDRNTLNNQRGNLRNATHTQNQQNQALSKHNASGFKGVSWDNRYQKWHAQIMINNRTKHLGYYSTPELAARAYDAKAKELHGEFAFLNFQ